MNLLMIWHTVALTYAVSIYKCLGSLLYFIYIYHGFPPCHFATIDGIACPKSMFSCAFRAKFLYLTFKAPLALFFVLNFKSTVLIESWKLIYFWIAPFRFHRTECLPLRPKTPHSFSHFSHFRFWKLHSLQVNIAPYPWIDIIFIIRMTTVLHTVKRIRALVNELSTPLPGAWVHVHTNSANISMQQSREQICCNSFVTLAPFLKVVCILKSIWLNVLVNFSSWIRKRPYSLFLCSSCPQVSL